MKKRSIILITGLMAFALLGVMAMQFYFLRQSYQLQSDLFDRSVNEALNNVVAKVSTQDAINFLNGKVKYQHHFIKQSTDTMALKAKPAFASLKKNKPARRHLRKVATAQGLQVVSANNLKELHNVRIARLKDSLKHIYDANRLENDLDELNNSLKFQLRVEEFTDEYGQVQVHQQLVPQLVNHLPPPHNNGKLAGKLRKYIDTLQYVYLDPQFGRQIVSVPRINPLWEKEQERKKRETQIKQIKKILQVETIDNKKSATAPKPAVFEHLAAEYQRSDEPLKQRIDPVWIDTLLRIELHNKGITLPFSYQVLAANNDSLIYSNAMDVSGKKPTFILANTYQTHIFTKEIVNDPGKLLISFPKKNSLILSNMFATMSTTGGLLLVLIFCFGYTIYSILRQKKISEMKTDFINNMTHEFKTPVSTIMIASEALKDAEIAQDKSRVARLANIIFEENVRLGSHIERVLNIAKIEKNDFKLDVKTVDVNEMIVTVIDSMDLKLKKHNVKLDLELAEGELNIRADELHFSNVIYNLIDNAIKYSKEVPEISISTFARNNQVVVKVADKGIGMSSDQQSKIFEQFYRIPTGNLHDVKGFGLGLSYVNTIVKKLNGIITVKSEKDKGAEFELKFGRS
jgi:two-component system phosphate regulon sensor histidine kinase PhoR